MNRKKSAHPAPSAETLLRTAVRFKNAAKVLASNPSDFGVAPLGLLASHSLEVALKAYLRSRGWSDYETFKLRHGLVLAWKAAENLKLPIEPDPPSWVKTLDFQHDSPHIYRYLPDGYGAGIPPADELVKALSDVIAIIEQAMKRTTA